MHFLNAISAAAVFSLPVIALPLHARALTPDEVVTNINIVATISGNLNDALASVGPTTSPGDVSTMSQTLVEQINLIVTNLAGDVTAQKATPAFTDDDVAQQILDSLNDFVQVHQAMLSTVIAKHPFFAQFSLTAHIAAVLRSLEGVIDRFAFSTIDIIPTKQASVASDKVSLDSIISNSIGTYTQICIPSPLYPAVPPVCATP